jgi:pimeloyl-ACP methyl ester carboxylesterase
MICVPVFRRIILSIVASVFFIATGLASVQIGTVRPAPTSEGSKKPPAIVIGFLGGFVSHDNLIHSEVQLAARLRKEYPTGVDVETFESYRGEKARLWILKILDTNQDGTLTPEEKQNARIIVYGHSWGGSESVYLARELGKEGIPVLLTVQVDSVAKLGRNDTTIPANVAQAANFYQSEGFVHGRPEIRAADSTRTRIIGNFRFEYKSSSLACEEYPWYDRYIVKPHTQIECDPIVWDRVESLIRANLLPIIPADAPR